MSNVVKVVARNASGKIFRSIVVDRRPVMGQVPRMTVRKAKKDLKSRPATARVEKVAA